MYAPTIIVVAGIVNFDMSIKCVNEMQILYSLESFENPGLYRKCEKYHKNVKTITDFLNKIHKKLVDK